MKRNGMVVAVVVVLLVVGTILVGTALAQGPQGDRDGVRNPIGDAVGPAYGFIDANGDGVNDRYLDGDCDGTGSGRANGVGYHAGWDSQAQVGVNGKGQQIQAHQATCDGTCTQAEVGEHVQARSRFGNAGMESGASANVRHHSAH